MKRSLLLLPLFLGLFAACATQKVPLLGTINVTVSDSLQHIPVAGAKVVATNTTGGRFEATTSGTGVAMLRLPQGEWDIHAEMGGSQPGRTTHIVSRPDSVNNAEVTVLFGGGA